ncbi:hypothetical protein TWF718_001574 [Orbilia javanica]|uniref:Uncharacterized protein n=1 Tax=Orbilia javanica TaxID=47235 RepID=A0AAN8RH88_9PEZI
MASRDETGSPTPGTVKNDPTSTANTQVIIMTAAMEYIDLERIISHVDKVWENLYEVWHGGVCNIKLSCVDILFFTERTQVPIPSPSVEQNEGMFENRTMRTGSMTLSPFDLLGTHNRAAGASIMVGVGRWDEESQTAQQ